MLDYTVYIYFYPITRSKQLYEIVYNRINSDFLLWEPQLAEQFVISPHMAFPTYNATEPSIYPAFGMCKGGGYGKMDSRCYGIKLKSAQHSFQKNWYSKIS